LKIFFKTKLESFKTSIIYGIPSTNDDHMFSIDFIRTNWYYTHSDSSSYNAARSTSKKFKFTYHIKIISSK